MWQQTGVKPQELEDLCELPESCFPAWKAFIDLHNTRTSNGFGVNPISYQETLAYVQLYEAILEEWELELIRKFDNIALTAYAEQAKQAEKQRNKK